MHRIRMGCVGGEGGHGCDSSCHSSLPLFDCSVRPANEPTHRLSFLPPIATTTITATTARAQVL